VSALVKTAASLNAPLTVPVRPISLDEWARAAAAEPSLGAGLAELAAPGMEYVADTYAGLSTAYLAERRVDKDVSRQLADGRATLTRHALTPTPGLAVPRNGPIGVRGLRRLVDLGASRFVLDESALDPLDLRLTLTRPFDVDLRAFGARSETAIAVAPDPLLSALLARGNDQPRKLAARIFAELAVLYLDAPGEIHSAVVAVAPAPDLRVWTPLLQDIARSGFLMPSTLTDIFKLVPVARDGADAQRPLVRQLRTQEASLPQALVDSIQRAQDRVESLRRMIGSLPPVDRASRLIALAEGASGDPGRWLSAVEELIDAERSRVQVVAAKAITLAASDGEIPISIQNSATTPLTVTISLTSERLRFPGGRVRKEVLAPRTQTLKVRVESLTSGSFPLEIVLTSPCPGAETPRESGLACTGELELGSPTRIIVNSAHASAVAIGAFGGALFFLLIWWGREVVKGHRRRRLNSTSAPADQEKDMDVVDRGQVALFKVVVVLAILALAGFDLGKPLVSRVNLDTRAQSTAAVSAESWRQHHDEDTARKRADDDAALDGAKVTAWSVRQDGTVNVTIEKTLPSWFFGRFFKSWYLIKASASDRSTT
jgi:hypothetical protein